MDSKINVLPKSTRGARYAEMSSVCTRVGEGSEGSLLYRFLLRVGQLQSTDGFPDGGIDDSPVPALLPVSMPAMDTIGMIACDRSQHGMFIGISLELPSGGALLCIDCDLGPSLEVDFDVVQPFPDTHGQSRTASRRRIAHPRAYWPTSPRTNEVTAVDSEAVETMYVVVGSCVKTEGRNCKCCRPCHEIIVLYMWSLCSLLVYFVHNFTHRIFFQDSDSFPSRSHGCVLLWLRLKATPFGLSMFCLQSSQSTSIC
ncbi:hypothetical protein BYT27DRAFT_6896195 [Phlegmacium glaucopus]|nr:hypothetical protein BYT27DRAFT_6896195 [Phlegmacium glaucopus]